MKEKNKISEEECVKNGGHCYEYEMSYPVDVEVTSSEHIEGNIDIRKCKHCGKKQKQQPSQWIDIQKS